MRRGRSRENEIRFPQLKALAMKTPDRHQPVRRIEKLRPLFFWFGLSVSIGLSIAFIEIKSPEGIVRFRTLSTAEDASDEVEIVVREQVQKQKPVLVAAKVPSSALQPDPFHPTTDTVSNSKPEPARDTAGVKPVDLAGETGGEIMNAYSVARKVTFAQCDEELDEDARYNCFQIELQKHLQKHLTYPSKARELGLEGKVYVEFVVGKDGRVETVEVIRGVDPLLDRAAIQALQTLPLMVPARNEILKPVRMRFTIPVVFKTRGS